MALAGTENPIVIRVRPIEDQRAPEGTVCLGTFIDERLVARCVVPPELHETLERHHVFGVPVRLVLSAREGPPGLQCQLFALAPLPPGAVRDDRRHPDSLSLEAADVLGRIVQGRVVEVVDKVLEDILRNDDEE
jgi:hypothetical protein